MPTNESNLENADRSGMTDEQRKAMFAKMGGGGEAGGYTGSARGGGSPMRQQQQMLAKARTEGEMLQQQNTGLSSDLTPLDMILGDITEEALAKGIEAAKESGNQIAMAGLAAAAMLIAVKKMKPGLAKDLAMSNLDNVIRQMDDDAKRMAGAVDELNGVAAKNVDDIGKPINLSGSSTPPPSPTGDIFRSAAAKEIGRQKEQLLGYARQADLDAVTPRTVPKTYKSIGEVMPVLNSGNSSILLFKNAATAFISAIRNRGPMPPEQKRAMFAKQKSGSVAIGKIRGSTQNFSGTFSPPKKPIQTLFPSAGGSSKGQQAAVTIKIDPSTGQPIPDQAISIPTPGAGRTTGVDSRTGKPIEQPVAGGPVKIDPKTGKPIYYLPPNKDGIGYYNPNQPYVPGQPRTGPDGKLYWGPKPGEPGYIDFDAWRKGEKPKVPPKKKPNPESYDQVGAKK